MAFISELHFRGKGIADAGEFVEITLGPNDDPNDFVVSIYDDDGTLSTGAGIQGGEVNLGTLIATPHPDDPAFTIYTIPVGLRNAQSDSNEGSGIALTNTATDTVLSFFSANNQPAFTATEGAASGATSDAFLEHTDVALGESYQWDIHGNLTFATIDAGDSVLCLAGDTRIHTQHGEVLAQDLAKGDMVWTADHGFQPVQWIGKTDLSAAQLAQTPKQRPITLAKNSLGAGYPRCDLTVSRQHRVLIASPVSERMTGESEVLIPAAKLLGAPGIAVSHPADGVIFVHILFDRHEVIVAEGALVESLMVTDYVSAATTGIAFDSHKSAPARLIVDGKKAKQLVARIVKNKRPLFEPKPRHKFAGQAA